MALHEGRHFIRYVHTIFVKNASKTLNVFQSKTVVGKLALTCFNNVLNST